MYMKISQKRWGLWWDTNLSFSERSPAKSLSAATSRLCMMSVSSCRCCLSVMAATYCSFSLLRTSSIFEISLLRLSKYFCAWWQRYQFLEEAERSVGYEEREVLPCSTPLPVPPLFLSWDEPPWRRHSSPKQPPQISEDRTQLCSLSPFLQDSSSKHMMQLNLVHLFSITCLLTYVFSLIWHIGSAATAWALKKSDKVTFLAPKKWLNSDFLPAK